MKNIKLRNMKYGIPYLSADGSMWLMRVSKYGKQSTKATIVSGSIEYGHNVFNRGVRWDLDREFTVSDWFETPTVTNSGSASASTSVANDPCKCDTLAVFQHGCKCGAIVPYEQRVNYG